MTDNNIKMILKNAIKALKQNSDFPIDVKSKPNIKKGPSGIDSILEIHYQQRKFTFFVEIKKNINNTVISFLLNRINQMSEKFLLVTRYVSKYNAEKLKEKNIQFIDNVGNVFINRFPLYIYISGNKPPEDFQETRSNRLFQPSGLKLLFTLLSRPELIDKPYREIAHKAKIALGSVGWIMTDLKQLGFIIDVKKRRKLISKEKLLERWCIEYPVNLKPKLFIGRFNGPENWWKNYNLKSKYGLWGGELAADKLTKNLKPHDIAIYVCNYEFDKIIIDNKLYRDVNGNVEFLKCFWEAESTDKVNLTVHPILIYADLLAAGSQRNTETANLIYDQYINKYLREN
ncbi:MAG: type IV toxin-antitoxin system AbiEi family antitoxin [bacterium]